MEVYRRSSWLLLLLGITFLAAALQGVQGEAESEGPSESECRPYIEKALKELATEDVAEHPDASGGEDSAEDVPTIEVTTDDPDHPEDGDGDDDPNDDGKESAESVEHDNETTNDQSAEENDKSKEGDNASAEQTGEDASAENETKSEEQTENEDNKENDSVENAQIVEDMASKGDDDVESHADIKNDNESVEDDTKSKEDDENSADDTKSAEDDNKSGENDDKSTEDTESADDENESAKSAEDDGKSTEDNDKSAEDGGSNAEGDGKSVEDDGKSVEDDGKSSEDDGKNTEDDGKSAEDDGKSVEDDTKSAEDDPESTERNTRSTEDDDKSTETEPVDTKSAEDDNKSNDDNTKSEESDAKSAEDKTGSAGDETTSGENDANSKQDEANSVENEDNKEATKQDTPKESPKQADAKSDEENESGNEVSKEDKTESDEVSGEDKSDEPVPEEELTKEIDIPTELRPRDHIEQLLKLDDEHLETEKIINRVAEITLRELKRLYENAIKPLEVLYKYRDLSNRHFGDPEIFAKPLVLFMGPWSGGKSSIINYLLDNEYNDTSLRTGAEPSPAYFNILMHGEEAEILEGTQLAADYTFSGLQKFGQGLEERLRGLKLPTKLLEKINIVEIPGILEVRKQVSRLFPFNDACQWFIDRADIIFLVYDPSKLDVGPETEAILDQLKGREHQTRIILNKADQVKPEELMRVQGALIWNISPLMSSAQPPIMYTTSLWSRPYEAWAPVRLLQAQERAFLRDLRSAIDKRIENKIASARRFAVRVRNHAKMVDCYLTTYYNHKSVFGNKKQVADEITEHPQDYHIYEGISTLTNISRYDLPDPDVYRDFFKLNPLYDFQQLSATCTYFRGCPINRLDVAIAYDLPELVGKHRRLVENALAEANLSQTPDS